jgi:putative flippase GtrA
VRGRLRRLALLTVVPTAIDVLVLVGLRQAGWILVAADAAALVLAAAVSYGLHRAITFRSDPFVRWVRMPLAFIVVALVAGSVDLLVLRGLFAAHGFSSVPALVAAKLVAIAAAAAVRLVLYRRVLLSVVRRTIGERVPRAVAPGELRASVVIPALDEEGSIGATVAAVRSALGQVFADDFEVVVVDDGSTDSTADAALAGGADQVVVHPVNRGKGAAVRSGVAASRGRTVAFTDADLAYSPDQLMTVIGAIEDGWDVAVGNRRHPSAASVGGAGAVRDLGSRAVNLITTAVLLSRPHDTQCGLKAFRSDVAKVVFGLGHVDGFAFDIEVLHLVERHELTLVDVPVTLRSTERSTVHVVRDGVRLLRDVARIRDRSARGGYELPEGHLALLDDSPSPTTPASRPPEGSPVHH